MTIRAIIFISLSILIASSCISDRKILQLAAKRGLINTDSVKASGSVTPDSADIDAAIDPLIIYIRDTIKQPCDENGNLKPETIEKIRYKIRTELVDRIIEVPFKDTLNFTDPKTGISFEQWYEGGEIKFIVHAPKTIIPELEVTTWEALKELWWLIAILVLIIVLMSAMRR